MCSNGYVLADVLATDLSDMERHWLHLVRLQCSSYEHNHAEGLDRAIDHAEVQFGADTGPEIASRIAVLIRAMRAERRGGFGYLSPFCPNCRKRITKDEWQLIVLMQAGYRGEARGIEEAAAEFAQCAAAPELVAAAKRFGFCAAAATGGRRSSRPVPAVTLH
jgi:hypothetical protein